MRLRDIHLGSRLALCAAAALWAGCGRSAPAAAPDASVPPATTSVATPTTPVATSGGDRRHRGGRSQATAVALPVGWPQDVPVPVGAIQGSTHAAPASWSVLTVADGPAADVLRRVEARYEAAGFRALTSGVLTNGQHTITIAVENRDHSATKTFVSVAVGS